METVPRTSKITLNYRHAHAHPSRFEMGALPQAHAPVLSVRGAAGWLLRQPYRKAHQNPPTKPTHRARSDSNGSSSTGSGTSSWHLLPPGIALDYFTAKFQARGDRDMVWWNPPRIRITPSVQNAERTWIWLKTPARKALVAQKPLPRAQTLALGLWPRRPSAWDRKPSAVSEGGGSNSSLSFPSVGRKERSTIALRSSWACRTGCLILPSLKDM